MVAADRAEQSELGIGRLRTGLDGGIAAAEQGLLRVEDAKEVCQPAAVLDAGDRGGVGIGGDQRVERSALAVAGCRQRQVLLDLAKRG